MKAEFFAWAKPREKIDFVAEGFWAWQDAFEKAEVLLEQVERFTSAKLYRLLYFNAVLHYFITAEFTYGADETPNPLFEKYKISDKRGGIISSASDESSSASYHITASLNEADFLTQDLMMTPYGFWVYQNLEHINANLVLL